MLVTKVVSAVVMAVAILATPALGENQWALPGGGAWSDPASWTPQEVPNAVGAVATLGTHLTVSSGVTLPMPVTVGVLIFDNSSFSYTLAGLGPLTTQNSGSPVIIIASGTHTVSVPVVLAGAGDTIVAISRPEDSLALSGAVSGMRGLTKSGDGVLILSNRNNSYLGGTIVTGGTLQGNAASIRGNLLLSNHANVTFFEGSDAQYAGMISGIGSVLKSGTGKLTLAAASNTYSGGTTVSAGTLQINTIGALPAGYALTIGASGTVVLGSGLSGGGAAGTTAFTATAVPEPSALALFGGGAIGLMALVWRRMRYQSDHGNCLGPVLDRIPRRPRLWTIA